LLQQRMLEVGYPTYMDAVPLDNGETTYRVRLGPFSQLDVAQDIARQIEGKSGFRPIILPSPAEPARLQSEAINSPY
jgi:hypothetical protein